MDRSSALLIVGLSAGLVVGAGAGLLAGSALFGEHSQLSSEDTHQAAALNRAGSVETEQTSRAPEVEAERVEGDAGRLAPIPAGLREALDAWPRSAPRNGEGWITGRVLDSNGLPVPDVTVRAQRIPASSLSSPRRAGQGPPREASLEDQVRSTIERFHQRQADLRETTTDSAGEFRLGGTSKDAYRMTAYKRGWQISARDSEALSGDEVKFTAFFVIPVHVTLLRASGEPADRASIEVERSTSGNVSSSSIELWTRDVPTLMLQPGAYLLQASNRERRSRGSRPDEESSEQVKLTLAPDQESAELTLRMKGASGIFGAVTGIPADAPNNCHVVAMRIPDNGEVDLKRLAESDLDSWLGTHTDEYAFRDLVPGDYAVGLRRSWRGAIAAHQVVSVRGSMVECDLEMPPLDPGHCLVVEARGPEGQPPTALDFTLHYEDRHGRGMSSGAISLVQARQPSGGWLILPEPQNDEPELFSKWNSGSRFWLSATSQQFGEWQSELREGQRSVVVAFAHPGSLSVTIAGYTDFEDPGRLSVTVESRDEGRRSINGEQIAADGTVKYGPMMPGDYEVLLRVKTEQWSSWVVASTPVSVGPGEQSLTLGIPALYSLSVSAPTLGQGESFSLTRIGDQPQSAREELDEALRVVFEFVPAGRYLLRGGSFEMGQMEVIVPSSGDVVFEPVSPNALAVTIQDPNGELAKAGFRDGDVVVSIGGKGFENVLEMQSVMMAQMAKEEVEFGVARGSEIVTLTLDTTHLRSGNSLGGELEPTVY